MVEPPPVVEDMIGGGRLPRQARSAELGSRAQERPLRQEAGRGLVATGALCCRRAANVAPYACSRFLPGTVPSERECVRPNQRAAPP